MESLVFLKVGFWQIIVIIAVILIIMVLARITRDKR
jgi:energy-coupling factor transporter transmembrane protein EcfT